MFDSKGYGLTLLEGAGMTLKVALLSLLLAALLGMIGAMAKLSRNRLARGTATLYTNHIKDVI